MNWLDWSDIADVAHHLPLAVDTLVFTFRVNAGVLSFILLVDWLRSRRKMEFPPYHRGMNDHAWLWAFIGMVVGCVSFIALDFQYRPVTGQAVADLFVAVVWWCWSNAVTLRMAARSARPKYVYRGVSIFLIGGFIYAFLAAL